jgi:HemY protein
MSVFLRLLALFAAAIGLAVVARYNSGNVVFFYPPYRVDLSLNLFLLLSFLSFLLAYIAVRTIRVAQKMPGRVVNYRQEKREREGNKSLRDALKAIYEGRFGHAEKAAIRAAALPENAGLAALIAARAAHRMRQSERRDTWLSITENDSSLRTARLMTSIELLVDEHKPEAALSAVKELNASGIRHIHALRWALKANQQAKNWPEVLRLVRSLDKNSALHPALSSRLRELAYDSLLSDKSNDAEALRREWKNVPAEDQTKAFVAERAAKAFNARGLHAEGRSIVEKALAADWDERLIHAYRDSAAAEGEPALLAQIERCEEWMKTRPTDAELALTLGSLCLKQNLWGKAQQHLEQALSDTIEPKTVREAHLKLAQLHDALNHHDKAAEHYRLCALATML